MKPEICVSFLTIIKFCLSLCVQQAIQIRQSPFSRDSGSDSSDIDEPNGIVPSLSCSRDKAKSSDRPANSRPPVVTHKPAANWSESREGSCSSASETSSDYAFPPEDGASMKTDSSDICLATTTSKSATAVSLDSYKKVHVFSHLCCSFFSIIFLFACIHKLDRI